MKKNIIVTTISFAALLFVLALFGSVKAQEETNKTLTLFVEEGCPYCEETEKFINENGLGQNIDIKDVRGSSENAELYTQISDDAGIPLNERGVPMLYDGETTYTSADQIISYLGEKYNVSTEGYLDGSDSNEDNSSSKYVVLSILGVGVLISLGYIILSMRKSK